MRGIYRSAGVGPLQMTGGGSEDVSVGNPVRSATLLDLDIVRFEREYMPAAVAPDVLAANDRTVEQRLAAAKFVAAIDEPIPTVLGVLVIGKDPRRILPGAYVQFLRIEGTALGDPVGDTLLIEGTIQDVVRRLDDKLAAHNRIAVDITSGPIERRFPLYPLVALQQLTRNAILHRSYEGTNAPVRVYWYDDRLEIRNPGGPYGEVTARNFGAPGVTDYRSPGLAEAMRVQNLVQRYGFGIDMARRALAENGNPPAEFQVDESHVLAVVRPARLGERPA